jgi:hypothetical protein
MPEKKSGLSFEELNKVMEPHLERLHKKLLDSILEGPKIEDFWGKPIKLDSIRVPFIKEQP